jgi:GNAT superfamily N-acetyltransferase
MIIQIRRAERKDCPGLLQLVRELAEYEKAPQEVNISLEQFEEGGFGPDPVWWAFTAEVDGNLAGFALYYIRFSTWKGKQMYLEDILVSERFRGNGIGSKLFERLMEECREKGFEYMNWQVLDWNSPAIRFYEKFNGVSRNDEWLNYKLKIN